MFEGILFRFYRRMVPQTLSKRSIEDILTLMLFVICAPRHYIQNPHIIAKAIEVIHWLCARSEHALLRQLTEYLFNHRLAQDSLVRALTKLYAGKNVFNSHQLNDFIC